MYYSSGNYEAFARPLKPEGVERKSAYLIGSGLASLAAACFLVRDAQMPGSHIHILVVCKINNYTYISHYVILNTPKFTEVFRDGKINTISAFRRRS